jgi:hypothetical protein
MAVALLTYGAIVIALGIAYALLDDVGWLSQRHLGFTALACTEVWLAGQLRAATRLRVLAFGAEPPGKDRSP